MKYFFIISFFFLAMNASSQTVLSSAGNTSKIGGFIVSWTVGEAVIKTFENGETILTQGFNQPLLVDIVPTGIEENMVLDMIAYPNPVFDKVLFKGGDPYGIYHIRVVDKLGRILLETSLPVNDLEVQMQGLENGTYLIEVVEDKTNKRRVFNVIKSTDR